MTEIRQSPRGRRAVLAVIRRSSEPLSVAEVSEQVGLHVNTVRGHLELLVHLGAVTRFSEHRGRRGRPRILYEPAPEHDARPDAYHALTSVLGEALGGTGVTGGQTVEEAGRMWAQELAREGRLHAEASGEGALGQIAELLGELGFRATTEPLGDRLYLQQCPYQTIRDTFPGICSLHAGLICGSLAVMSPEQTLDRVDVDVHPGLCVAHVSSGIESGAVSAARRRTTPEPAPRITSLDTKESS